MKINRPHFFAAALSVLPSCVPPTTEPAPPPQSLCEQVQTAYNLLYQPLGPTQQQRDQVKQEALAEKNKCEQLPPLEQEEMLKDLELARVTTSIKIQILLGNH